MARLFSSLLLVAACSLVPAGYGESHNPADYPLRIHIFRRSQTTFYYHRQTDEAKGDGRGNLFEGGEPKAVDFQFECDERLQTSSGYETFPAKWKKPNEELVVLQPKFGTNNYSLCRLKVLVKDFAYYSHEGVLNTEPSSVFKEWMVKHDYDPEHGKNTPTQAAPAAAAPAPTGSTPASVSGASGAAPGGPQR